MALKELLVSWTSSGLMVVENTQLEESLCSLRFSRRPWPELFRRENPVLQAIPPSILQPVLPGSFQVPCEEMPQSWTNTNKITHYDPKKSRFLSLKPDSFYLLQNDFCRVGDCLCHRQVIKIFSVKMVKYKDKSELFFPWADRLDENIWGRCSSEVCISWCLTQLF